MKLLLKEQRTQLIENGNRNRETGETSRDAVVKFFDPAGRYTFYVFEAELVPAEQAIDGREDLFLYGYCVSPLGADCDEWGYTSLNEIENGRRNVPMERDMYFRGVTVDEINAGKRP